MLSMAAGLGSVLLDLLKNKDVPDDVATQAIVLLGSLAHHGSQAKLTLVDSLGATDKVEHSLTFPFCFFSKAITSLHTDSLIVP